MSAAASPAPLREPHLPGPRSSCARFRGFAAAPSPAAPERGLHTQRAERSWSADQAGRAPDGLEVLAEDEVLFGKLKACHVLIDVAEHQIDATNGLPGIAAVRNTPRL